MDTFGFVSKMLQACQCYSTVFIHFILGFILVLLPLYVQYIKKTLMMCMYFVKLLLYLIN